MESEKRYPPERVILLEEQRFEGNTDPGDSSILYLLETDEGERGTLVNSYGAASNQEIDLFIDKTIKTENNYD